MIIFTANNQRMAQNRIIPNNLLVALLVALTGVMFFSWNPVQNDEYRGNTAMRVVFYNVENLFDPFRDSLINDIEYSPGGMRYWTYNRFKKKCQDLAKVLIAAGEWEAPDIIGLCEIENRFVLKKLLEYSALDRLGYEIVHYDSPDERGIDVAMLYRPEKFEVLHSEPVHVIFPGENVRSTRDILYVKGLALDSDTLHLFVNHWPSRYGGYMVTKPLREFTGALLRSYVDSIVVFDSKANILIMGDFNDPPDEQSIEVFLGAVFEPGELEPDKLYNLMGPLFRKPSKGSHKFQGEWSTLDQFIVSQSLLNGDRNLMVHKRGAIILDADFLLEDDPAYTGKRLNRTYYGMQYMGGYSDHLPIIVDILRRIE